VRGVRRVGNAGPEEQQDHGDEEQRDPQRFADAAVIVVLPGDRAALPRGFGKTASERRRHGYRILERFENVWSNYRN
jgi:hypothetical protein